ncbi:MAG TPA: ABC transporter substrate-binding protein [Candidatus Binatia bacterium]|jgi:NitT/TauT family transport system substrate-binding protein|nr:ABC transporter substrate-binding protein [Candidatus Binatia bacterium]
MRKSLLALLAIVILETSALAVEKIRIGVPELNAQFLPLALAEKRSYFKEDGLQGEIIRINPTVALAALVSGELDYWTVIGNSVGAIIQGAPLRVLACYVPGSPSALITRPEFKSVQELRGKAIGLNTSGGALESTARLVFKHFGLDPDKEIKFLPLGTNERRFSAMKQGLTAGTMGSPPLDFLGKKMGFVVLARAYELFNYPTSGVIASARKIKEKPDEVKRVITAGIKAARYIRQNREGTIQFMTEWSKIDREMATATYESVLKLFNDDGSLPEKGLLLVIDELKKLGKVEREISVKEVADLSILREAQKELGIIGR